MGNAVVLDRDPSMWIGEVEAVSRHAVDVDPVLRLRDRQAMVDDAESRPRLAGGLGPSIDERSQVARLDDAASSLVAHQEPPEVSEVEPVETHQGVGGRQSLTTGKQAQQIGGRT